MIDFQQLWALLYEHGSNTNKSDGARQLWLTLTEQQQAQVFNTISTKLREGKFVHYDPIRAINECVQHATPRREPHNYNADSRIDEMMKTGKLVCAKYKGLWGMYTIEDVRDFGLETRG